jgi:hypothetical protein
VNGRVKQLFELEMGSGDTDLINILATKTPQQLNATAAVDVIRYFNSQHFKKKLSDQHLEAIRGK